MSYAICRLRSYVPEVVRDLAAKLRNAAARP